MEMKPAVFISIASYRDSELIPTLCDLIDKASGRYRLAVAVCWQDDNNLQIFQQAGMTLCGTKEAGEHEVLLWRYAGVEIQVIALHYFLSQGACWARHLCETLYQQENYFLQIDSHCRFVADWDSEMIAMLTQLKATSARPVLSSYPPGYEPGKEDKKTNTIFRLVFRGFSSEKILQLTSVDFQQDSPVRGSYLAGGFIFAEGSFVRDVPNDPQIFFEGEEIAMAARAFTHGYDVWHPHKALLWHFYGRKEFTRIWGDHTDEAKKAGSVDHAWYERDRISKRKVRALLGMEQPEQQDEDKYALGKQRTLAEFEATLGVSFTRQSVLPEVVAAERIAWFPAPHQENWQERLTNRMQKEVTLAQEEVAVPLADIDSLHIGVYSDNNDLIYKKTLSGEEISASLVNGGRQIKVKMEVAFSPLHNPTRIRFSPYDENEGWGKVVERVW
ncbi:GlcNAc-transferase family protein [Kalamiella sp. sgz302252]|uniref:GlcNAc-transferase family protein n=1 Tax=Pantoea sp. sgz302252 TaxID=3341827 RepID=UPI0036D235A0